MLTVHLSIFISVINQLDEQNFYFTVSLFHASTCFEQWIQDPSGSNVDNLNNVRCNASRHFRSKKKAYQKDKFRNLKLTVRSTISGTCIWGINDFKKGYQPRTIIVKYEKVELFADPHSIKARCRNYFSQLLNVHEDNEFRQAEIHTVEPQVPEPSAFEVELAIGKLKNHKSPGIDQIPAELIKAVGTTICCAIRELIISI